MWILSRHRAELEQTNHQQTNAEKQAREAEARKIAAGQLVEYSRNVTQGLRKEINKNGWTELLQEAMGGRTKDA